MKEGYKQYIQRTAEKAKATRGRDPEGSKVNEKVMWKTCEARMKLKANNARVLDILSAVNLESLMVNVYFNKPELFKVFYV